MNSYRNLERYINTFFSKYTLEKEKMTANQSKKELLEDYDAIIGYQCIKFLEVLEILKYFNEYVPFGCNYLIENRETVTKFVKSVESGSTTNVPFLLGNDVGFRCFMIDHPDFIEPVLNVFSLYTDKGLEALIRMIHKNKESLRSFIQSLPNSKSEPVPMIDEPKSKPKEKSMADRVTLEKFSYQTKPRIDIDIPTSSDLNKDEKAVLPILKGIEDLTPSNIYKIRKYVEQNPFDDKLISPKYTSNKKSYVYNSGSYALMKFLELPEIEKSIFPGIKSFTPGDNDIFFLRSVVSERVKLEGVDLIYTTAKTVEEFLLNFDLPCCRFAIDCDGDFYYTAQAILAVFDGTVIMPNYVFQRDKLEQVFQKIVYNNIIVKKYVDKFYDRIIKYTNRGFIFEYRQTDKTMNFISKCMSGYGRVGTITQ